MSSGWPGKDAVGRDFSEGRYVGRGKFYGTLNVLEENVIDLF